MFARVGSGYPADTASVSWKDTDPAEGARAAVVVQVNTPAAIAQFASSSEPMVLAGIESEITTPAGTVEGPWFVTVIV